MKKQYSLFIILLFPLFISAQCISGNCIDGEGTYRFPSGAIYTGSFFNGEVHGLGICKYMDGSKYDGNWNFRFPEGQGTKTYPDGNTWTGNWKKGLPINEEGLTLNESKLNSSAANYDGTDIQTGCILNNCENGIGTYAYVDGSKYEGQFKSNKKHGWGSFYYSNGDKYTGDFVNNFSEGYGTMYYSNGSKYTGSWYNGAPIEKNLVSRGAEGCINGNCKTGYGTYIYDGGVGTYEGEFKAGLPHGYGSCIYANGEKYEGFWKEGGFDGEGILHLNDGTKISGHWQNGTLVKQDELVVKETTQTIDGEEVKIWAVIIGVSSYEHMHTLSYSDDDAYKVYAYLKSPEGGALADSQIKILIDDYATRDNVLTALTETYSQAGPEDMVVMYFSGHGLKGSFLPIDFDGHNNKIFHEEINDILSSSPAKFKFCIADACHSGSLFTPKGGLSDYNPYEGYYQNLAEAQPGMALILSSLSEETSLESNNLRQGVFSHFLLRGLKGEADGNQDSDVSIQELFNFIHSNVKSYTDNKQSPTIKGEYDPNMIISSTKER